MSYYLGIDIGGTKVKAVVLRGLRKQRPKLFAIDTPGDKDAFLGALHQFAEEILLRFNLDRKVRIGVGLPGIVDLKGGVLVKAPNIPFLDGWNVGKFFRTFGKEIKIDNDSRCFLRAEAMWGAARGYKNVVGFAIGTGIGAGIIIDEKMYYGSRNGAGEIGHTAIALNAQRRMSNAKSFESLAGKGAFLKYGDRSELIGIGVANVINMFDSDIVVLGGGGVTSGVVRLDTVRSVARQYVMSPLAKRTPIIKGTLGDTAAAIGAALLWKEGY